MTVGTDRAALDLPPATDCKYGDFVKLENAVDSQIRMMDFVILGQPRKLNVDHKTVLSLFPEGH